MFSRTTALHSVFSINTRAFMADMHWCLVLYHVLSALFPDVTTELTAHALGSWEQMLRPFEVPVPGSLRSPSIPLRPIWCLAHGQCVCLHRSLCSSVSWPGVPIGNPTVFSNGRFASFLPVFKRVSRFPCIHVIKSRDSGIQSAPMIVVVDGQSRRIHELWLDVVELRCVEWEAFRG